MKKLLKFLFLIFIIFIVSGCSNEIISDIREDMKNDSSINQKIKNNTFELNDEGFISKVTFTHTQDVIIKQELKNTLNYAKKGMTKESAENQFNNTADKYKNIIGLNYTIEFKNDEVIETIIVDFTKADLNEIKKIPGFITTDNHNNQLSFAETKIAIKNYGYTEID